MALISLRDLGMVTPRPLFQNLTLSIGPGDRIGLVAGNPPSCAVLPGRSDQGSVVLSRGAGLGYVEQDVPPALLGLPLAEVLAARCTTTTLQDHTQLSAGNHRSQG